ncbi:MAG TPA: glycosyltransferase [Thermoanaerobaculia bacterium]
MKRSSLDIAVLGLSISSSWGNGHATTYRGLVRELSRRGHHLTFYERDAEWNASHRDLPEPDFCRLVLYASLDDLFERYGTAIAGSDMVIIGSFVPEGIRVIDRITATARGVVAFYDLDTPVTLDALRENRCDYLSPRQIPRFDLYLSSTGGPTLALLERDFEARAARPLYSSVDPELYFPVPAPERWDLACLGTYSADRQETLERLLLEPARVWADGRFAVAGPQYPDSIEWPRNVERIAHVEPEDHRTFYCSQRFTLNVTREPMVRAGYSPSVRLFEAAACGIPILTDPWPGLEDLFEVGSEVIACGSPQDVLAALREVPEEERRAIGARARRRVLRNHTAAHRAEELERYFMETLLLGRLRPRTATGLTMPAAGVATEVRERV